MKISQYTSATSVADADIFVIVQGGVTKKVTASVLKQLLDIGDAFQYKGVIDASINPNYPAGSAGHAYKISVAGKVGGASGKTVEAGDLIICNHDGSAAGDEVAVGAYWDAFQGNMEIESPTVENDMLVGGNSPVKWVKKTLAQVKTILGIDSKMDTITPTATNDVLMAGGSPLSWVKKTIAELKTAIGFPSKRVIMITLFASETDCATGTAIQGDLECPFTGTITAVGAWNSTAGSGSPSLATQINIKKGGTTIFTASPQEYIEIPSGTKTSRGATQPTIASGSVTAGNILTFDVVQVSTTPAKGLVVRIEIQE